MDTTFGASAYNDPRGRFNGNLEFYACVCNHGAMIYWIPVEKSIPYVLREVVPMADKSDRREE